MKIDITNHENSIEIIFFNHEIKSPQDKIQVINIITTFAGEFELDPELEDQDIELFVSKAQKEDQNYFKVIIDEEGITVDLQE